MKLWVLIVNYRTPRLTLDCVRSLQVVADEGVELHAVVVDNDSADGSAELLARELPNLTCDFQVSLVTSSHNGGFAFGNNEGIRQCLAETLAEDSSDDQFVWLLNPDAYLLAGGVEPLLAFFHEHPAVGIVGSRIEDELGQVQCSAFRRHSLWSEIDTLLGVGLISRLLKRYSVAPMPSELPSSVDWVSGASFFMRLELLKSVGLMDEGYFMYFEETDYCLTAKARGHEVWYWPGFSVVHLEGQASGITGEATNRKRRPKYWFDSRARFFRKHYGSVYLQIANLAWLISYPLGRLWRWLRGKPNEHPPQLWWDFFRYYYLGGT